MTTPASNVREYDVRAQSAAEFGRVICSARNHHFVADGPVQNGCPGEAITPPELFLTAVASCAIELIHVIARDTNVPLHHASVAVHATVDRDHQSRMDVTLFNSVRMDFEIAGASQAAAVGLVDGFRKRCPIFGTITNGMGGIEVNVRTN